MSEELEFREFFASQFARLRRLGFWLTGDWGEAEELAQDALVRTYRRWRRVRRYDHPEEYAVAAVARLLGIPDGTVKTLARRGLARLRDELTISDPDAVYGLRERR